jgi:hypothetical protein
VRFRFCIFRFFIVLSEEVVHLDFTPRRLEMQVPTSWSALKRQDLSEKVLQPVHKRSRKTIENLLVQDFEAAVDTIQEAVYNSKSTLPSFDRNDLKQRMSLQHILSYAPYLEMLQREMPAAGCDDVVADIPIISKAYEEMFMRESISETETACVMGENCECMFINPRLGFIGVCFQIPGEEIHARGVNKMCVLCCRKTTQKIFYDMMYVGACFNGEIQRYGNICNQPGEYAECSMLICPPSGPVQCMPLPIVAHQRNRYSVHVKGTVKYIQQHRVAYEDFHLPSSCN